jgi:hypothetical protein
MKRKISLVSFPSFQDIRLAGQAFVCRLVTSQVSVIASSVDDSRQRRNSSRTLAPFSTASHRYNYGESSSLSESSRQFKIQSLEFWTREKSRQVTLDLTGFYCYT